MHLEYFRDCWGCILFEGKSHQLACLSKNADASSRTKTEPDRGHKSLRFLNHFFLIPVGDSLRVGDLSIIGHDVQEYLMLRCDISRRGVYSPVENFGIEGEACLIALRHVPAVCGSHAEIQNSRVDPGVWGTSLLLMKLRGLQDAAATQTELGRSLGLSASRVSNGTFELARPINS